MKKIVVFTGAGVSAESGVPTFRDTKNGLWYNYKVEEVATIEGWKENRKKVLEFHNMLRTKLKENGPNDAHKAIADLEKIFEVTVVTQNVDDLHERAGSKNVLHLHGELFKSRSSLNSELIYECLGDINIGDKCELGSQLRPHTVLFGEWPYNVDEAYAVITTCDYLIIVGTSFNISYTPFMIKEVNKGAKIYYVDPAPSKDLKYMGLKVKYIKKKAVEGVGEVIKEILKENV